MKHIKRWWAEQVARSATGQQLGHIIARNRQLEQQNKQLQAENRRLANAHRAIIATHEEVHTTMERWQRMTHWEYAIAATALETNQGRPEAKAAPYAKKTQVAEHAESAIHAAKHGTSAQAYYMDHYWKPRWQNTPENVKGSHREYRAVQRKAKRLEQTAC